MAYPPDGCVGTNQAPEYIARIHKNLIRKLTSEIDSLSVSSESMLVNDVTKRNYGQEDY